MDRETKFAYRFHANASIAEQWPLIFYTIYMLEVFFHSLFLLFSAFVVSTVFRTILLHRNFRLFFCITMIQNEIAIVCRFILMYYQSTGTPIRDGDLLLVGAQLYREIYFVLCTLISLSEYSSDLRIV
ncbi:hypothetical protein PMAYCL1PPCAC_02169 [Pristionchus mayeri]|uniref:G protein-coupled receptor n=1 Tax=Pristionchus mayeri TaxID=1317129 RepID=A0AAN4Z283_9BILA|nr:hypothetical protein PMAYCL1PPCAC_02169 [Pristionchus mayeri]